MDYIKQALDAFNRINVEEVNYKDAIIKRLLEAGHITADEALVLMKVICFNIETKELNVSSGGKLIGGSDFHTTNNH